MDISGKIIEIFDTQQIKETFKKREFVLEYAENPTYPEFLKFDVIQDKCAILDDFKAGDEVKVQFNLKGRKWTDPQGNDKYFNTLQAWKIDNNSPQGANDAPPEHGEEPDWMTEDEKDGGDLPV